MAILPVLTDPDQRLRRQTYDIERVDDTIRKFMHDMLDTMYNHPAGGIGLAALQVNKQQRILVIDLQDSIDEEGLQGLFPLFVTNPKIVEYSHEKIIMPEGCLSVPEQTIEVMRPKTITLQYLDRDNKEQILYTQGYLARVIQHEVDHLEGKLITDYLSQLKRDIVKRKLLKLKIAAGENI